MFEMILSFKHNIVVQFIEEKTVAIGLLGTKLGMTQIFDDETGAAIPVTVMKVGPCTITQIKTSDTEA